MATNCDFSDKDKFMMLMINNGNFQKTITNAIKAGERSDVEQALKDCNISLTDNQIETIMNWSVTEPTFSGYQNIVDISKNVYDPDAGTW